MPDLRKSVGKAIEWPIQSHAVFTDPTAGLANDTFDTPITSLASVSHRFAPGAVVPPNPTPRTRMQQVISAAAYTTKGSSNTVGNATNNADLRINVWRGGLLQGCTHYYPMRVNTTMGTVVQLPVATTATTAVTSGSTVITPASVTGIVVDGYLSISGGTGTAEYVTVTAVTSTTFTASFSNAHSGTYNITTTPVATTSSTAVTAGSVAVTPASMVGIYALQCLYISGGTGTPEYINVVSVTSTTFTATFNNNQGGSYNISSSAGSVGGQLPVNASSILLDPAAFGVVPTAMTNIVGNLALYVGSGATAETIYVQQTQNGTSFVANFAFSHADTDALTAVLVPNQPIYFIPANTTPTAGVTSNTLIAAGSQTAIPSSIYGIHVGDTLAIAGGTTYESGVTATTVASTALTATFAQLHSGTSHIGYYVSTTSATTVTGDSTTAIVVASAANIVPGQTLILQGTGADSSKSDTNIVSTVVGTTVTFTAAIATNSYSHPINVTSVAYLSVTTTTIANKPSQVVLMTSTTGLATGDLVAVQNLVGNSATAAFTGTPEVCFVQAVVTNTSITISPTAVHTNAYAIIPFTKTTFATAVTSTTAATTVTLTSGTNFITAQTGIYVWSGTQAGITETVTVTALSTNGYNFTATFAQPHSGAYTITSTPSLVGPTGGQQLQLATNSPFVIRPLDSITIGRVSNNATGLAAGIPTGLIEIEYVPAETLG